MIKFKFTSKKLTTDYKFFMFSEFVDIWNWDRSRDKTKAHNLLYFIFLLADLSEENPIRDEPLEAKEGKAFLYAFGSKRDSLTKKELELAEPALACYIKYNNTAEERVLDLFDLKAEELRVELENTMPETVEYTDMSGTKFATNAPIITKGLSELGVIKKSKIAVVAAIKREALSNKIRGQIVLSPLSKGTIGLPDYAQFEEDVEGLQRKNNGESK